LSNLTDDRLYSTGWAAHPVLTRVLCLVFLAALLWGLGSLVPSRADPGTLYVAGASGSDAGNCQAPDAPCQTIGYAISRAVHGDSILIAGGVYTENLGVPTALTLRGGYAVSGTLWLLDGSETTINGSGAAAPVIGMGDIGGGTVTLESLSITGGEAECSGGVCAGNSSLVIRNCVIYDNTALGDGGGGGVAGGNPTTIQNSYIINNHLASEKGPGETGGAGAVRTGLGPLVMVNTVVAGNTGDAAIHVNHDLSLMNVTIANNSGDIIFGAPPERTLAIANSIVYHNTHFFVACPGESTCINYSDVQGWVGSGTGNIDADPRFLDAANRDFHLKVGSPCVDSGTPTGAPANDVEGTARDAAPDMGAYEWTGFRLFLPLTVRNLAQ